jgi:hypothetical protein
MEVNSHGGHDAYEYCGLNDDIAPESENSEISTKLKEITDIESQIEFMKNKLGADLGKIKQECLEFDESQSDLRHSLPYFTDLAVSYFEHPIDAYYMHSNAQDFIEAEIKYERTIRKNSKTCREDLNKIAKGIDDKFLKQTLDKFDYIHECFEEAKSVYQHRKNLISEHIIAAGTDEELAKSWGKFQEVSDKCISSAIAANIETVDACRTFIESHKAAQPEAK